MASIEALTDRYLHGVISSDEQAELNVLLAGNPAAAEHFANVSRMEGYLEQAMTQQADRTRWANLLPARPPSRSRLRWRIAGGVSLAVLAAAAIVVVLLLRPATDVLLEGTLLARGKKITVPLRDETMSVPEGGSAKIRLRDGSLILARERTEFLLHSAEEGASVVALAGGKADFDVPKRKLAFQVNAKPCTLETFGARFTAETFSPEQIRARRLPMKPSWRTNLAVAEGEVRVFREAREMTVAAGEQKHFTEEIPFTAIGRIDAVHAERRLLALTVYPKQQGKQLTKKEFTLTDDFMFPESPQNPLEGLSAGMVVAIWAEGPEERDIYHLERLKPQPGRK